MVGLCHLLLFSMHHMKVLPVRRDILTNRVGNAYLADGIAQLVDADIIDCRGFHIVLACRTEISSHL